MTRKKDDRTYIRVHNGQLDRVPILRTKTSPEEATS